MYSLFENCRYLAQQGRAGRTGIGRKNCLIQRVGKIRIVKTKRTTASLQLCSHTIDIRDTYLTRTDCPLTVVLGILVCIIEW